MYDAGPRRSFVAALKDVQEVWEVSYDPKAPEIPAGVIHDFQYREGAFVPGFLNARRTVLDDYLDDFFFTPDYNDLMGASREGKQGQVVNLDVRRKIATLDVPGMPHLGSGITWMYKGRRVMATPNLQRGRGQRHRHQGPGSRSGQIRTLGPGFFMRSHENTPLCLDRRDDEPDPQGHAAR